MGGNALRVNCIRINKELYNKIKLDVITKLKSIIDIHEIYEIPNKDSFGDLDLLYVNKSNIDVLKIVNTVFNPVDLHINGDVLSFSYHLENDDYFQIDLIKTNHFDSALFYFSYGDLGNILGRITKKYNLTFGIDGLWTIYNNERIMLIDDPEKLCKFLDLDYNKWKIGFTNNTEIFDWIICSKFFDCEYFKLDNLNNTYKHRYLTRPFFQKFIDYIKDKNINNNQPKLSVEEYIIMFDKLKEKEEIDNKLNIIKLHQTKYSGSIFLNFLKPKDINKYKDAFRTFISNKDDFNNWLIINDQEFINKSIEEFIKSNNL